jgi:hypothetical protein
MIAAMYVLAAAFGLVLGAVIYLAVRIWLLERQAALHADLIANHTHQEG